MQEQKVGGKNTVENDARDNLRTFIFKLYGKIRKRK